MIDRVEIKSMAKEQIKGNTANTYAEATYVE